METLSFVEIQKGFHLAKCDSGTYVALQSGGIWYWYLVHTTNAVRVASYEAAVAACQKHFEGESNAG